MPGATLLSLIALRKQHLKKERVKKRNLRDVSNPMDTSETFFILFYRLNKRAFQMVLDDIASKLPESNIPANIQLAAVLRFLAVGSYQAVIANDINISMGRSTFCKILWNVMFALEESLCPTWISLESQIQSESKTHFYRKFGIPGVIGCVDGTLIKIMKPPTDHSVYFSRKGHYSINAMMAYAAGCNIVILASTFERVQIIPGARHGYVKISALDCSTDTGKIAAAYENKVFIFEPTPILQTDKRYTHFLDYRWVQTGSFISHSHAITLSWNLEGTRLLTGGSTIQLWKEKSSEQAEDESAGVKFVIGGDRDNKPPSNESTDNSSKWENIWLCQTAIPIYHMAFSPDGTLFATCGRNDRLVKIWYENKQILFPSKTNSKTTAKDEGNDLNFTYVYIAHPRAVTNIIWRKTSKYMPKGSVSNMIVTSCLDNICRIWIETVLPDDGLINMSQFDPLASQNPKFRTHRHKHRFMQRLKHMKTCFHIRRHAKNGANVGTSTLSRVANSYPGPIPSLPSSCSVHDFHSYGFHGTGISQGVHFHLAASINAETDIPLVPSMHSNSPDSSTQNNFILHWLNNKEMDFTLQAEAILQELTKKVIDEENNAGNSELMENYSSGGHPKKKYVRNGSKSVSVDDNSAAGDESKNSNLQNINSMSNTTSLNSLNNDNNSIVNQLTDSLDIKIDCLLRDWHQSPDLLFAIHPVDGSYLIWVVEWLDDYYPGSFRQAQVSFSTRIPNAFPLGDSMSMSTMVSLYNTGTHPLVFREIANNVKSKDNDVTEEEIMSMNNELNEHSDESDKNSTQYSKENNISECSNGKTKESQLGIISTDVSPPSVSMVTKHSNGTLNLWQLSFAYKTKFTQVLSIGHVSRVSGHRFRVNDINCHPVLPLLVSTSHHNLPEFENKTISEASDFDSNAINEIDHVFTTSGFCSELILWRVDSVGPLCHSGGVSELARINSPEISAFSNVAWIPTLLPSTTLGSYSNSPSACFVASDGENLCVFQAVIDARTLLAEISASESVVNLQRSTSISSLYSNASSTIKGIKSALHDKLRVVSQQSTARPGCIIQLDPISDAKHDWQNTQFLHVFQAQLITGGEPFEDDQRPKRINQNDMDAIVDLQQNAEFEEPFYIVIIEKTDKGSTIHMWRIVISSKQQKSFPSETAMYVPDSNLTQDVEDIEAHRKTSEVSFHTTDVHGKGDNVEPPNIVITTEKVCTQELPLPDGVDVIHASPAAGHLSSSSIYPACYAPYIIVTACSDSISRFWNCKPNADVNKHSGDHNRYVWSEWKMFSKKQDSAIEIPGQPLNISAAYSGRVACAYKYGKSFTRPNKCGDPDSRYINLCVSIFECESSGGSEWVLEDTIHLKNIHLPRINIDHGIDLSYLHDNRILQKKQRLNQVLHNFTVHDETRSPRSGDSTPDSNTKSHTGLLAVPSFSTLQSLRKSIAENGNTCPLTQKHLVQLDWVSKEDGSHILTVAVGSKILLYTPVSSDIAQANIKAMKESRSANRPILRKASSLAQPNFNDEIRWMKVRQIDLQTADGLPPLPMQISWVRDGILVVAMDSEMHVYSQWKPRFSQQHSVEDTSDTRNLRDEDLRSIANESTKLMLKSAVSMPLISKVSTANLQLLSKDKKKYPSPSSANPHSASDSAINEDYMTDFGLFQASRIACPVLPQYHPKQLMELLNCGKIRWVKAILAHLVRCLKVPGIRGVNNECDDGSVRQRSWSRSRTLSISYAADTNLQSDHRGSSTQIPEELMLDYAEITSIPPLPLWVLLNADKETAGQGNVLSEDARDYDQLFEMEASDDNLDDLLDNENDYKRADRRLSLPEKQNISHFGPRQGQILSRLLTHTHLPGLSSLDQMHLLALADTVSTCNTDFSEKFISEAGKLSATKDASGNSLTDSLDDCGLRFLMAMKHYTYLLRCLPLNQRTQFQKHGIGTSNIVWAFHSESEDELLNLIPSYNKGDLKWSTLKDLGMGYWLRNINILRKCVEKLAKCAYQLNQDPLDAAIYYLAMKKKSIVWGLFRSKRDEKMTQFFANNFSEDRWRKAALKNAFVLLGKQRFEHAVAFFLLANSLNDAIEVCINKLDDYQLALIIARLYEGDLDINVNSTYKKLLCEHILGHEEDTTLFNLEKAHPDPFLRSMIYWILKRYQESLNTLLINGVGQCHVAFKEEDIFKSESHSTNPNVFNFYIYLRTHPLLVRQNLALSAQEKKISHVVLSGFSYAADAATSNSNDKQLQIEDSISSIERQLYFTTAHAHFKAGCPALALEVLNKLPTKILDSNDMEDVQSASSINNELINTGILEWGKETSNNVTQHLSTEFDWSTPITLNSKNNETFQINWDDDDNETDNDGEINNKVDIGNKEAKNIDEQTFDKNSNNATNNKLTKIDIMAQQLKFVACLKILMEELSTLATGFEVDGGQLRYQLYIWLEKEVEALQYLCNYCNSDSVDLNSSEIIMEKEMSASYILSEKPTLHEILMHEKHDFEVKVMRAAKRKRWLKANETLLRTLLSYCSLHGASGGGLASVRMELVLLLQELQQEKTQQQLLSPLPFPTTLPLLSACVAGNKTVIADPIKYLQSQTIDMLHSIIKFSPFTCFDTNAFCEIFIIRDLSVALSSCIYQSLCDSESFVVNNSLQNGFQSPGIENIAKLNSSFECSHLIGNTNIYNRKRMYSTDEQAVICTTPSKWPGVTNLRALLASEKDEDIPKLNILLLETFIATYVSLATYALVTCDSRILYRLVAHHFSAETWSTIFGGGMKKLLRKATCENQTVLNNCSSEEHNEDNSVWNTVTSITKQRVKLNMKILGSFGSPTSSAYMKEDKPTYREQFASPEMSMLSYFLTKPKNTECDDYDTDDPYESNAEEEEEDVFANDKTGIKSNKENKEHLEPMSFSWCMLRLAVIKMFVKHVQDFINISGIELQDLPVLSPLSHEVLRTLNRWQDVAQKILISKGPPNDDYIPGIQLSSGVPGISIHKYRSLLNKDNTPFVISSSSGPVRRLWNYLVRQDEAQDVFIKALFGKKMEQTSINDTQLHDCLDNGSDGLKKDIEPIRIIHKDHESILAFCLNNNSSTVIAVSNPREVQELDISLLLESPNWCEDECDYDMLGIAKDNETTSNTGFLMIQTSEQMPYGSSLTPESNVNYHSNSSQSGRGTDIILKHKIDNVKRMSAHPLMPLYLTGGQDGSVQIWEWGHQQVVCIPRPSGTFAKVTRCRFSEQGNKFGIGDGDGNLSLWQAGIASQNNRSFFTHQCHNKTLSDFVFLGSCSLLATAGQSSENRNIVVWDTLLPQKKSCVSAFTCHDQGASCFGFAPQHQLLISCGKKGDICIFDMRQRTLKHRLQGHDSCIKCISIDPHEEFFATGSIEGDIKVWNLNQYTLITTFAGEHAKNSFFKHIGQGVSQIHIDAYGHLFSCGSDGCMKVRQLFEKDTIVQSMY